MPGGNFPGSVLGEERHADWPGGKPRAVQVGAALPGGWRAQGGSPAFTPRVDTLSRTQACPHGRGEERRGLGARAALSADCGPAEAGGEREAGAQPGEEAGPRSAILQGERRGGARGAHRDPSAAHGRLPVCPVAAEDGRISLK
ncbi:unnamed protein product [Caretta caretta]